MTRAARTYSLAGERAVCSALMWQAPATVIILRATLPSLFHTGLSSLAALFPRIVSPLNREDQSTESGYVPLPNPVPSVQVPWAFDPQTVLSSTKSLATHIPSHSYQDLTCLRGSNMNSSVLDTSTKCWRTYLCADLRRSLQECVSAKPRIPRQLDGSSWLSRNLQQASRTPLS